MTDPVLLIAENSFTIALVTKCAQEFCVHAAYLNTGEGTTSYTGWRILPSTDAQDHKGAV